MDSYAILGMGLSGESALSYLIAGGATRVTLYVPAGEAERVKSAHPDLPVVSGFDSISEEILVRSPGIRPDAGGIPRALARGARLTSECELFLSACPAPVYAVTGSDGKTTTSTLAALFFGAMGKTVFLGGNIGVSLLSSLPGIRREDRVVLELSSFQLMGYRPPVTAGVVTNLSENHLNWHTDMAEYRRAKRNLLEGARCRVQNARAPIAPELCSVTFSATVPTANYALRDRTLFAGDIPLARVSDVRIPGVHNLENILAAAALTEATPEAVRSVVTTFSGVPHRMEYLGEVRGVPCYNSSIDTTPARTDATLSALPRGTVLCGGRNKNVSLIPLADTLIRRAARVWFFGEDGEKMQKALLTHPAYRDTPAAYVGDFGEAVIAALSATPPGEPLILSPAATSFDAFPSYTARGDAFRNLLNDCK